MVLAYVNDLLITPKTFRDMAHLITKLEQRYDVKNLGKPSKRPYIEAAIKRFWLENAKPVLMLLETNLKIEVDKGEESQVILYWR